MRILLITDSYPVFNEEEYSTLPIKNFVQNWESQGHEIRIIKPNFLIESFLNHKTYTKTGMYKNIENLNYLLPFTDDIKKKIRTLFAPDIVISHGSLGTIFTNKLGCSFSVAVHNSDIEILTNPLFQIYFKPELEKAYEKAQKIACPTIVLKEKFLKFYPQYKKKTFVAPCGISPDFINKRIWIEEEKEKIKILTFGDSIKQNNIDKIIETCENIDRIELTVIGGNKKKLEKLSLKIILTEPLSHQEILQKMKNSDIFILPTKKETFGLMYLESMANGCITICSKKESLDGIIKDSFNGFLCEDVEKTLKRVIDFPDKNWIINNAYETISNLSDNKASTHYINCLVGNYLKI